MWYISESYIMRTVYIRESMKNDSDLKTFYLGSDTGSEITSLRLEKRLRDMKSKIL